MKRAKKKTLLKHNSPQATPPSSTTTTPNMTGMQVMQEQLLQHTKHTGPLPAPLDFSEYEKVLPGAAERILLMTENESKHRRAVEIKQIDVLEQLDLNLININKRGQIFGFAVAILCLISALICVYLDHPTVGGTIGSTTIIGLVTVFITGRRLRKIDTQKVKD